MKTFPIKSENVNGRPNNIWKVKMFQSRNSESKKNSLNEDKSENYFPILIESTMPSVLTEIVAHGWCCQMSAPLCLEDW